MKFWLIHNKKIILVGGILVVLVVSGVLIKIFSYNNDSVQSTDRATVTSPQGVDILVRVADTEKTRMQGLSGVEQLGITEGMWFVFPQVGYYAFWMKDMNFPIDIIWIDENFIIIDRVVNVSPDTYPKTFTSSGPVKYVLEIPAGTADLHGFTIGELVIFTQP